MRDKKISFETTSLTSWSRLYINIMGQLGHGRYERLYDIFNTNIPIVYKFFTKLDGLDSSLLSYELLKYVANPQTSQLFKKKELTIYYHHIVMINNRDIANYQHIFHIKEWSPDNLERHISRVRQIYLPAHVYKPLTNIKTSIELNGVVHYYYDINIKYIFRSKEMFTSDFFTKNIKIINPNNFMSIEYSLKYKFPINYTLKDAMKFVIRYFKDLNQSGLFEEINDNNIVFMRSLTKRRNPNSNTIVSGPLGFANFETPLIELYNGNDKSTTNVPQQHKIDLVFNSIRGMDRKLTLEEETSILRLSLLEE
jgi:hypothetical protein